MAAHPRLYRFWQGVCLVFAILLVCQILLGWYMRGLDFYHRWYHAAPTLHRTAGLLILCIAVVRFSARAMAGLPRVSFFFRSLKANVFGAAHLLLYLSVLVMALSGYIASGAAGGGVAVYLVELPSLVRLDKAGRKIVESIHYGGAFWLAALLLVHGMQRTIAAMKRRGIRQD